MTSEVVIFLKNKSELQICVLNVNVSVCEGEHWQNRYVTEQEAFIHTITPLLSVPEILELV